MALLMKESCDKCAVQLEHESTAYICSFECTFCAECSTGSLAYVCPNCGAELVIRPKRKAAS